VDLWSPKTLTSLVLPGGLVFLVASVVLWNAFGPIPPAIVPFSEYALCGAGILLAWRFHSSRILFALLTLLLAHRALEFFSAGRVVSTGPGRIALEAVALLLPLNFIIFSVLRERGLALSALVPRLAILFFESVFVAILCRPGQVHGPAFLHPGSLGQIPFPRIPTLAVLAFAVSFIVLLSRFLLFRKPAESGLLWALLSAFVSLQVGGVGSMATAYQATAALILVICIIENSYFLAYHDELTALPGRRAFHDALFQLEAPYAVAGVDIDHFKRFNDTYGHETGDQVLRMVAARLAEVTGGGQAYRIGGEEFCILFPGKTVKEVQPHLELLRSVIEVSSFRVRAGQERRGATSRPNGAQPNSQGKEMRNPERRSTHRRTEIRCPPASRKRTVASPGAATDLSVTVSIGVAEPNARVSGVEEVMQAADKALYRAKRAGRNRVEAANPPRPVRLRRNIA
jgi:diguanylate cyclase (GGDEF)-like protein